MQSKPKANSTITTTHDATTNVITFTVKDAGTLTLDLNKINAPKMKYAALHGLIQRVSDAAAIGRTDDNGRIIPEATRNALKLSRMGAIVAHLEGPSEDWRVNVGAGGGGATINPVLEAVAEIQGVSVADMAEVLDRKAEKLGTTRRKLLNTLSESKTVKEKMAEILTRSVGESAIDADDMLNSLKGE